MTPNLPRDAWAVALLAAAALGGAPRALAAGAAGHGGTVAVTADPEALLLGRDGGAALRIVAPRGTQAVELSASLGRVEDVRREADGVFVARYVPPSRRVPQVAIVAAVVRDARGIAADGWAAIPMSAGARLRVKTRPGVDIALRVGDRSFGPRRAGADGVAILRVEVPPGVREAHHGFRPIDLGVPQTTLLHVVADRVRVRADLAAEVHVLAYVVAPHGAARRGDVPVFEATRGRVAVSAREPGAFVARWSLPPGASGSEHLVVRLPGAPASHAVVRVEASPGPPARIAMALDRASLAAGDGGAVEVTARALDSAGNATAAPLALEADVGDLSAPERRGEGAVEARWRLPARLGGRRAAVVTARVPGTGAVASRTLVLAPGAPEVARFESGGVVVADGASPASLRLEVRDRFGNAVSGLSPIAAAQRGRILAAEPDPRGGYRVRYAPPAVSRPTEDRVDARVAGLRARAELALVPPRGALELAPEAGWASDTRGRYAGATFGLAAEKPWRALPADGALRAEVGWAALAAGRERATLVTALAGAAAHRLDGRFDFWTTAGAGVAVVTANGATGASPAGRLAVGAGLRRGWGTPFVEVGALAAGRATPATGAFAAVTAAIGVRFQTRWLAPGRPGEHGGSDGDAAHRR